MGKRSRPMITRHAARVRAYRSNVRVYRLIDRRNASLMIGKAVNRNA